MHTLRPPCPQKEKTLVFTYLVRVGVYISHCPAIVHALSVEPTAQHALLLEQPVEQLSKGAAAFCVLHLDRDLQQQHRCSMELRGMLLELQLLLQILLGPITAATRSHFCNHVSAAGVHNNGLSCSQVAGF